MKVSLLTALILNFENSQTLEGGWVRVRLHPGMPFLLLLSPRLRNLGLPPIIWKLPGPSEPPFLHLWNDEVSTGASMSLPSVGLCELLTWDIWPISRGAKEGKHFVKVRDNSVPDYKIQTDCAEVSGQLQIWYKHP